MSKCKIQVSNPFIFSITVKKSIDTQRNKTRKQAPPQKENGALEQCSKKKKNLNKETSQKTKEN